MIEIFKDIKDWEGLYQISNLGRVFSLAKGDGNGNKDRFLKPDIIVRKHCSYHRVTFSKKGKIFRYLVHRLVANAFIPNLENKPFINHKDNNGINNIVSNLEWCTHKENMEHSSKQGRQDITRELGCKQAALNRCKETEIKFKSLLGLDFISISYKETPSKYRTYVIYKCKCGNTHKSRIDSLLFLNVPVIRRCCKDENIV